ncbi:MAG: hypothetical protein ABI823_10610 [Bryobacteraceae bacterium]
MQTAALWLGIPVWAVSAYFAGSWNFAPMFDIGLFMVVAGFLVALGVYFPSRGFLRLEARNALQFHGGGMLVVLLFGVAFLIASQFDPSNPTMSNPPAHMEVVLFAAAMLFGFVAPVVILIRSIASAAGAWKRSAGE